MDTFQRLLGNPNPLAALLQGAPQMMQPQQPEEEEQFTRLPSLTADGSGGALGAVAQALGNVNFSDPNALATFEQQVSQLEGQLNGASKNVETYLAEHCGLGTASPSS